MQMAQHGVLSDDEIRRRLAQDLPRWRFEGNALRRLYRVNGFRSALIVANTIGHLAEAAWHHPDLMISWGKVEVALWSHDAGGVSERDFALAQRIEDVAAWRPFADSPLEGTPGDPQNAHVLPD
ncbi:MAG: 4a-hydroxytetrahydrobiopterin dehydratase [Beijerinckiaceae bacterium]